jgi:chromosome segregation ATPase
MHNIRKIEGNVYYPWPLLVSKNNKDWHTVGMVEGLTCGETLLSQGFTHVASSETVMDSNLKVELDRLRMKMHGLVLANKSYSDAHDTVKSQRDRAMSDRNAFLEERNKLFVELDKLRVELDGCRVVKAAALLELDKVRADYKQLGENLGMRLRVADDKVSKLEEENNNLYNANVKLYEETERLKRQLLDREQDRSYLRLEVRRLTDENSHLTRNLELANKKIEDQQRALDFNEAMITRMKSGLPHVVDSASAKAEYKKQKIEHALLNIRDHVITALNTLG